MLGLLLLTSSLFVNSVTSTWDFTRHPVKACHIGDVVQNECTRCLCTSKAIFECIPIDCNRNKIEIPMDTNQTCLPNQLYVQNLITCICTKDGKWPHKSCQDTFLILPPNRVVKHKCDPDSYVVIDCNVCKCGLDGEFIPNRCTKNSCEKKLSRRHHKKVANKKNSVYSNCEEKVWYSLAPCQFCYCINENKLVCNTGNDQKTKLELGTYDMLVCGTDMIKEALELVPKTHQSLRGGDDAEVEPKQETTTVRLANKNIKVGDSTESYKDNSNFGKEMKKAQDLVEKGETDSDEAEKSPNIITTTTTPMLKPSVDNNMLPAPSEEENEDSNSEGDNSNELDNANHLAIPDVAVAKNLASSEQLRKTVQKLKMAKRSAREKDITNDIPEVLNNMFSMTLRKSMVTLDKGSQCTPGTSFADGCNQCFCLKNGKLLCSSQKC